MLIFPQIYKSCVIPDFYHFYPPFYDEMLLTRNKEMLLEFAKTPMPDNIRAFERIKLKLEL